jgi:hypothetical protein
VEIIAAPGEVSAADYLVLLRVPAAGERLASSLPRLALSEVEGPAQVKVVTPMRRTRPMRVCSVDIKGRMELACDIRVPCKTLGFFETQEVISFPKAGRYNQR